MKPPAWCCHPGRTACTTLTSGENDTTWDAGLYKAKPVGGYLVPVNYGGVGGSGVEFGGAGGGNGRCGCGGQEIQGLEKT